MESQEINLEGVNGGKAFRVERLSTEATEIISEAREKYPTAKEGQGTEGRYILRRTLYAILLSSNSLMAGLDYKSDTSEYRAQLETITARLKLEDISRLVEIFQTVNADFIQAMKKKAEARTIASSLASSSPQPQAIQSSMPPA
jgi:hypothetical protein